MSHSNFCFERTSKRRKGFPSEQRVRKGDRVVHGNKELIREARAQRLVPVRLCKGISELLPAIRQFRRLCPRLLHEVTARAPLGALLPEAPCRSSRCLSKVPDCEWRAKTATPRRAVSLCCASSGQNPKPKRPIERSKRSQATGYPASTRDAARDLRSKSSRSNPAASSTGFACVDRGMCFIPSATHKVGFSALHEIPGARLVVR